jgi:large subunit ribosomal protein L14
VVKEAISNALVKKKEKVRVVIVRTKKETGRIDGSYIRFSDNAGVIIDTQNNPRGTRIFGPIAREIKDAGFSKIASMAKEVY